MDNNKKETDNIFPIRNIEKIAKKINAVIIMLDQIQKKNKCISSFLGLLIFYFLGFILPYFYDLVGLDCFNFISIDNPKAIEIINQRFTNMLTIIGFTFAIFALTLNNLAEKDRNIKVFIEESHFLNIVYFVILSSISILFISLFYENSILIQDLGIIVNYLTGFILALFFVIIKEFIKFINLEIIDKIKEKKLNDAIIKVIEQDKKIIWYKSTLKPGEFKLDLDRPFMANLTNLKSAADYYKEKMFQAIKNFEFDQFKQYEKIVLNAIAQNITEFDNAMDKELGIYNFIEYDIRPWIIDKKNELKDATQQEYFKSFECGIKQITTP